MRKHSYLIIYIKVGKTSYII